MQNKTWLPTAIATLVIAFLFIQPAQASTIKGYIATKSTVAERVYAALDIMHDTYPDWRDNYQPGEFDCSEMSEYVKHCFRQWGIKSTYCQSDALWHCWIEVPCREGKILIEATTLEVIPESGWNYYYQGGDVRYNRKMLITEINWWHSDYIQSRPLQMRAGPPPGRAVAEIPPPLPAIIY